jgi:hypothetical protein
MRWSELLEMNSDANSGKFGTTAARVTTLAVAMIVVSVDEQENGEVGWWGLL